MAMMGLGKCQSKQTKNVFDQLVDLENLFVFELDDKGFVRHWSLGATRLTGYSREDALAQNFVTSFLFEGSWSVVQQQIENVLAGIKVAPLQITVRADSGKRLLVLLTCLARYSSTGAINGIVGVGHDVTDLVTRLEKTEDRLEICIQELDITNAELSNVCLVKDKNVERLNHKLCTPLNSLLGFNDLLSGEFYGKLNSKQMNYVSQIDNSGHQLLRMIHELMAEIEGDLSVMTVKTGMVKPKQFVHSAFRMMENQFEKKGIVLLLDMDNDLPEISSDFFKARQVILNLLSNALKYTASGGWVRISVARENDAQIKCQVSDTGIGIAVDEHDKIFADMGQPPRVDNRSSQNTGNGLSVTRSLVQLLGGEIGLESLPGNGSTFWFTLGLSDEETSPKKVEPVVEQTTAKPVEKPLLLVVEDNEANLLMICALLRTRGYDTEVARTGKEALEKAQEIHPDIILMDIRMPEMDGIEATQLLRAMPEFAETPIIAVTAGVDPWSWEQLLNAGCSERLAKPIASNALFAMLKRYVGDGMPSAKFAALTAAKEEQQKKVKDEKADE